MKAISDIIRKFRLCSQKTNGNRKSLILDTVAIETIYLCHKQITAMKKKLLVVYL